MAINLLPSEEKSKVKKEKTYTTAQIEMTGPAKAKGTKPGVKRAGVLTFFKGAFAKPKKAVESTTDDLMRVPKKKVQVEQKIILEQAAQPKPEKKVLQYQKPQRPKPTGEALAAKKDGNILVRMFRREQHPPQQAPTPPPHVPDEQFPKYKPIKAEQVRQQSQQKKRNGDIIKVTTQVAPAAVPKSKKKAMRDSIWHRFSLWLRGLFGGASQPKQVKIPGDGIPEVPQRPIRHKQRLVIEKKTPGARMPTGTRSEQKEKFVPLPTEAVKESIPLTPIVTEEPKQVPVPPPPPEKKKEVQPLTPIVPVTPHSVPKKEKKETEHKEPPTQPVAAAAEVKDAKEGSWLSGLFEKLSGLFSKKSATGASTAGKKGDAPVQPSFGLDWEVNLVPEEAKEQEISISRVLMMVMFVVLACGAVFGGWLWANWYYNSIARSIDEVNQEIAIKDIQINSYQQIQDDVAALKKDIDSVQTLLEKHVYWSAIFQQLERYTSADVYFTGLTADVNGSVSLNAVGRNYEAAIKQLFVFERASDFVSAVTISDIAFSNPTTEATQALVVPQAVESSVTFSVDLKVLPTIFYFPR